MAGGTFSRSPNGVVECEFPDGHLIACDQGARNCRIWDAESRRPGDYSNEEAAPAPTKPRRR